MRNYRTGFNRVVITGVGPICALGKGPDQVWENILLSHILRRRIITKHIYSNTKAYYKYTVEKINLVNYVANKSLLNELYEWQKGEVYDDLKYLIASVKIALEDAKIGLGAQIGFVISHENPCLEKFLENCTSSSYRLLSSKKISYQNFLEKIYERLERNAYETQSFMMLYHVAKLFNVHDYSLITNNACSSGLFNLELAAQLIRENRNNIMIVAASDFSESYKQCWLMRNNLYSEDGTIRPFSKDRNGFVLGDGVGTIVLESLESAINRKAKIYAEYLGGGFALESWKVTLPSVNKKFFQNAINQALKNSSLKPEDINLVNAHGIGTIVGDKYESLAINDVFGKRGVNICAFKPYVGHTLGASSLLETILLLLCMKNREVPPTLNCMNYDESLNVSIVREKLRLSKRVTALKTSYSFAGYIASVIFRDL